MGLPYTMLLMLTAFGAVLGQGGFGGFRRHSEPSAYLETPHHETTGREGIGHDGPGYESSGHDSVGVEAAKYLVRKAEYHSQDGLYGEDGRFYRQARGW